MSEQITLEEVYRLLGERDVLIFKLQQQLAEMTRQREEEKKQFEPEIVTGKFS